MAQDLIAQRLAARSSSGVPEPEFRLPAMLIPALIGPPGVLTFGLVIAYGKSWLGAAVGFAMLGFGLTAASNVIVTYCIDAYRPVGSPRSCESIDVLTFVDIGRGVGDYLRGEECNGMYFLVVYLGLDSG